MQNEKLQVVLTEGCNKGELVIREVDSVNELAVQAPVKIAIIGTIQAVSEFLNKRISESDQINQKKCHILVNREVMAMELVTNESDYYLTNKVIGTLSIHPKFKEFGINSSKSWTPTQLGAFLKMNRACFPSKEDNMKLVNVLMNFTASVNNTVEKAASEKGDRSDKFEQVVNSNLPSSFSLTMPLFKGHGAETFEVETFAQINGREISFILISPGAQATIDSIKDSIIDEQLALIQSIAPDIAIIEQ
jgi:hypothetical protein